MTSTDDNLTTGVGNTNQPPGKQKELRNAFLTYNNPTTVETTTILDYFESYATSYVMQQETGESGNFHLQGVASFKTPKKFETLKKLFPKVHWEVCRNISAAKEYCSKLETRTGKTWTKGYTIKPVIEDPLEGVELYEWQKDIIRIISTKPDRRTIHWYYDTKGNIGKTTLAKHICLNHNAIYIHGKGADIKHAVAEHLEKNKSIDIVIYGVTRGYEEHVSYEALECVKDGIFFSGKYESSMQIFNSPHVIVLCNFAPNTKMLSLDRWNIVNIEQDDLDKDIQLKNNLEECLDWP